MSTLTVGRVDVAGFTPRDIRSTSDGRGKSIRITGTLLSTSLPNTKALRSELEAQRGKLVNLTLDSDDSYDAYYVQRDVRIDARHRSASLQGAGLFEFDMELDYVGNHSETVFRSALTGILKENDQGVIQGEAYWFHAPPAEGVGSGVDEYTGAGGGITAVTRTTEDGDIPVFLDQGLADLEDPSWSCDPASFYAGAARVDTSPDGTNFYTRAGRSTPNVPHYFVLGNGLVEFRAEQSGGLTIGDISVRAYNGSWGSWVPFDIVWNSTTDITDTDGTGAWHSFSIVRNDPSVVTVQLRRDAQEAPPSDKLHTLQLTLRRGAPFAIFDYHYSTAVALTVDRASPEAATSITPTGASSAMAATKSSDDGDGNRWIVGTSETATIDTTNGGIDMTTSQTHHQFFLGSVINGGSAQANDQAGPLCLQYLGQFHEWVTARTK